MLSIAIAANITPSCTRLRCTFSTATPNTGQIAVLCASTCPSCGVTLYLSSHPLTPSARPPASRLTPPLRSSCPSTLAAVVTSAYNTREAVSRDLDTGVLTQTDTMPNAFPFYVTEPAQSWFCSAPYKGEPIPTRLTRKVGASSLLPFQPCPRETNFTSAASPRYHHNHHDPAKESITSLP